MRNLLVFIILLWLSPATYAAQLSLIIDDLGYRHTDKEVLALPAGVTFSILPHTPFGQTIAKKGHALGHEILLHIPMQALNGKKLGPGGLTNEMNKDQVQETLSAAIKSVPYARGANNHMGSLLTQLNYPMSWIMESLKQHKWYFIDSATTRYSKVQQQAKYLGVPLLRRELFLDNSTATKALEKQFNHMIIQARKKGHLIVIAHPHPETLAFLKKHLVNLKKAGISLVPPSHFLPLDLVSNHHKTISDQLN